MSEVGKSWLYGLSLGALLLAACDGEEPPVRGGRQQPEPEPEPEPEPVGRSIVGLRGVEWRSLGGGVEKVPDDLDAAVVQAHCPDGEGWTIVPGHGEPDGSFVIAGAPEGHCWVRIDRWGGGEEPPQNEYLWTDAATIDLASARAMRRETRVAPEATVLRIEADGFEPWVPGDHVVGAVVPNVGFFQYNSQSFEGSVEGLPDEGGTEATALTYDLGALSGFLLDGDAGDRLSFTQWAVRENAEGIAYAAPFRGFESEPVTIEGGETVDVRGTLEELPTTSYRVHWAIPAFDGLAAAMHERATPIARGFALQASHGTTADEWLEDTLPTEAFGLIDPSVFDTDALVDLGEFEIGVPYGEELLFDWYESFFVTTLPWPNGIETEVFLTAGRFSDEFPTADEPARPLVGPVRSIRVAGLDTTEIQPGVGLAPLVSWEPPALGSPTSYEIHVIEPGPGDMPIGGFWRTIARLVVPADVTEIRLPADVLREGGHYALLVRAVASDGQQVRTAPLRRALPHAWAEALTEPFQP